MNMNNQIPPVASNGGEGTAARPAPATNRAAWRLEIRQRQGHDDPALDRPDGDLNWMAWLAARSRLETALLLYRDEICKLAARNR